jgi:ferredoxin
MILHMDKKACIGCGCCGEACPQGALELAEKAVLIEEHCIGCGACIEMCPTGALSLPAATT